MLINNKKVLMEIDTVTLMSVKEFRELFPHHQLQRSKLSLRTYTSEELQIVGETTIDVTYQSQSHGLLRLVIVKGEGPTLFGRDYSEVGLVKNMSYLNGG